MSGRDSRGERNGNATLTMKDVREIRCLLKMQYTNMAIGEAYGVHHSMISRIRLAKSWGLRRPITKKYSSLRQPRRGQVARLDMARALGA